MLITAQTTRNDANKKQQNTTIASRMANLPSQHVSFAMRRAGSRSQRILTLSQAIHHAPNPRRKTPGAGRRVNVERRGQRGEQYIDATTGDIQLNLDWRAPLSARLHHEQSSANPIMADANSIAESQQKPSDRPKHHPPREPVLQVIGDLF